MKHWSRILAALLAVCMLWSMCGAVAETPLEIDPEQGLEAIAPEIDGSAPDLPLALNAGLDLGGLITEDVPAANEGDAASDEDGGPFIIDDDGVLVKYTGKGGNVVVPDGVVAIDKKVFANLADLKSVTIPESVAEIRAYAFNGCEALAYVTVLASNITIANNAFKGTTPVFRTVIGSSAAEWARKHKFTVEENVVVLTKNTTMKAAIGDTYRIVLKFFKAIGYASSDPAVATVSDKGLVTVRNGGTAQINVTLENEDTLVLTLNVPYPPASLSKTSLELKIGDSATLTIENLSGRTVSWTSDNDGVATVKQGKVTAVRAGKCVITAKLSDGTALKCKVTVTDPAKLNKTKLKLKVGGSYTLKVNNLGGRKVTWSSSNASVASVKDGKVTAHKAGTCTITAQVQNGKALKCKVTVTDPAKLNKTSLSLQVGGSYTLKVEHLGGRTVTWTSSNTAVATVQGGKVTARKAGSCTITAKLSDGKTLTCKVTVTDSAKLNKTVLTLKEGETFKLAVTGQGSNSITWTSTDEKIATVDKTGLVKAVKAGKCSIKAKLSSGKILECKLTVETK